MTEKQHDLPRDLLDALRASGFHTAADEIERCHERLEIDHYFTMRSDGEMVRREVPMQARLGMVDGIECRDATIHELTRKGDPHDPQTN